jgi:hypothetical protein
MDIQEGIREMVLFALQPSTVWEFQWSAAVFPMLASITIIGIFFFCESGSREDGAALSGRSSADYRRARRRDHAGSQGQTRNQALDLRPTAHSGF